MVLSRQTGLQNFACSIHATLGRIQRGIAYQNVPCRIWESGPLPFFFFFLRFLPLASKIFPYLVGLSPVLVLEKGRLFISLPLSPAALPSFFFFLSRESGPLALAKILGGANKTISLGPGTLYLPSWMFGKTPQLGNVQNHTLCGSGLGRWTRLAVKGQLATCNQGRKGKGGQVEQEHLNTK